MGAEGVGALRETDAPGHPGICEQCFLLEDARELSIVGFLAQNIKWTLKSIISKEISVLT